VDGSSLGEAESGSGFGGFDGGGREGEMDVVLVGGGGLWEGERRWRE